MVLSTPRKRSRDVEDEFDKSVLPLGKRAKAFTVGTDSPMSNSLGKSPWQLWNPHATIDASESDSANSNVSEAGSTTDDSMDMDMDASAPIWSPSSPGLVTPMTVVSEPTIGTLKLYPEQHAPRSNSTLTGRPTRPKPYPLQSMSPGADTSFRRDLHDLMPRSSMSVTFDRQSSPIDDHEPHTPTTVTGSQLSMLSVSDMEVDSRSVTPVHQGTQSGSFVRRQRQRSGAFISTPDNAKKIQFGYRPDCEKCRSKVPGHMNHFLEA